LISLVFVLVFFGLIVILAVVRREGPSLQVRQISAFSKIHRAIEMTVEAGTRLHISIGRGTARGQESAAAFVGLSMLERITKSASTGDNPPVVTAGNPALTILAQDTLKSAYKEIGLIDQYQRTTSQLTGVTPFSFAAGVLPIASDKQSSTSILVGSFGPEVALITDACERSGNLTMGGTDDISSQAILYATANEPLIGEELYAGGAYLDIGPIHTASLQAQDILRWLLVIVILVGILFNLLGFDQAITAVLDGIL
jgi:hypothetical protein